jgi:hypothetical protein
VQSKYSTLLMSSPELTSSLENEFETELFRTMSISEELMSSTLLVKLTAEGLRHSAAYSLQAETPHTNYGPCFL